MQRLSAGALVLEPLTVAHADAMFAVLADAAIYRHLDDAPPSSLAHLRDRYARLAARVSPDGRERWLNWILRLHAGAPIGFVQATITQHHTAWVAYVLSRRHWGRGHASAAMRAMLPHLAGEYGVLRYQASVEAANLRSIRLLERLGFRPAEADELARHALSPTEQLFLREATEA